MTDNASNTTFVGAISTCHSIDTRRDISSERLALATAARGPRSTLLGQLDCAVFGLGGPVLALLVREALEHIPRDFKESFLNVVVVFGTRLEKFDAKLVRQRLAPRSLDYLLLQHVALVPNQNLVDVVRGVLLDLPDPVPDVVEGLLVCNVVHKQYSHRSSVVSRGDGAEALLPRRVPDLQLELLALLLDGADLEVDADGGDEGRGERIIREAQQQTTLSHP
mmetsp:Transcript_15475/g.30563  ORF Transcript_15475/g.30563 Transcript_15475/m.30563 type:complete len:222 (+) Transcript_15475:36-701(+)|eukprot:CAMPEP_0173377288 /NCGR_PEP_ID=MMETSP1356-20130122/472_1 /TAXON_ID=77927 ORGANISM="Hemiselmis virescens, Strain PCC157" /NCGR_SAMPLE_ID=MMETSP1356 /ASSEMBLY_ACC=CAM_ASM_000847 /LENGTH=221 /DNA_ID=CAMNT_0014329941 /DNA_START=558 /DNA_END=1223 /DNA_ORIENTATION=-